MKRLLRNTRQASLLNHKSGLQCVVEKQGKTW